MFEHWRQLAYFDNVDSVFPSPELLDELELYDSAPRNQVAKAFSDLVNDFHHYLTDTGIYEYFHAQQYGRVIVNNECMLFY
jgi:hypothetical protein